MSRITRKGRADLPKTCTCCGTGLKPMAISLIRPV